jgi:hypothetical protein
MQRLLKQLNKTYFWDINPEFLDDQKSRRIIIERIMNLGNLDEIKLVRKYYGDEVVKDTVTNLNYIDPKTLNFLSLLFDIPKNKFKCYTRKQSNVQHWNS